MEPSPVVNGENIALKEMIASGKLAVYLSSPFNHGQNKEEILSLLALGPWGIPDEREGNKIFARGTSAHAVYAPGTLSSSSLFLPMGERLDFVIKSSSSLQKAKLEINNLERIIQRGGVRVVEPVGYMVERYGEEKAYTLTRLVKGVIPFDNLRIENLEKADQVNFLRVLAGGICEMHNNGIAHMDLHLSNVAYDPKAFKDGTSLFRFPQIVFFDFEKAQVFPQYRYSNIKEYPRKACQLEKRMAKDLAKIYLCLTEFAYRPPKEFVDENLVKVYLENRSETRSSGCPNDEFMKDFEQQCRQMIKNERGRYNRYHKARI